MSKFSPGQVVEWFDSGISQFRAGTVVSTAERGMPVFVGGQRHVSEKSAICVVCDHAGGAHAISESALTIGESVQARRAAPSAPATPSPFTGRPLLASTREEFESMLRMSNAQLLGVCESRGGLVPLVEDSIIIGEAEGSMPKAKVTRAENGNIRVEGQLFTRAGFINRNRRIYKPEVMKPAIEGSQRAVKAREFGGAVDHPFSMERTGRTCMMFTNLAYEAIDDATGYGLCDFEINAKHQFGTGLASNIEMGMAVGLSTYGWGYARRPDDAEREKYKLPDSTDVVMITDYQLVACDSVYGPSESKAVYKMK